MPTLVSCRLPWSSRCLHKEHLTQTPESHVNRLIGSPNQNLMLSLLCSLFSCLIGWQVTHVPPQLMSQNRYLQFRMREHVRSPSAASWYLSLKYMSVFSSAHWCCGYQSLEGHNAWSMVPEPFITEQSYLNAAKSPRRLFWLITGQSRACVVHTFALAIHWEMRVAQVSLCLYVHVHMS